MGRINLDQAGAGASRSTAQTLLFGPGGRLFVPISNIGVDGVDTGAIRRYRLDCISTATRTCFANFVRSGGKLGQGWYLTFGQDQGRHSCLRQLNLCRAPAGGYELEP